jgi:purine-binding chemotaxis protein CheW
MTETMDTLEAVKEEKVETKTGARAKAGKYLTFILGEEQYGLEILKVREIISVMEITEVPQVPTFIKGVINLRGKVIPVIDLRLKFGMSAVEYTRETCIIVVNVNTLLLGIVVDTVAEVLNIDEKDIDPPPTFGSSVNTNFILGMGKVKGNVKILLDIDMVMSIGELDILKQTEQSVE